ncbi:YraN family protein [Streptomyces capparidis]
MNTRTEPVRAPVRGGPAPRRRARTAPARGGPARAALARYGETVAARRLAAAGMTVLARNWRCREGELDIVARDGDAVVVCEVKTRSGGGFQHPLAAVGPDKARRLRHLAERWVAEHCAGSGGPPPGGIRIDVVGVVRRPRGAALVEHVRGVA